MASRPTEKCRAEAARVALTGGLLWRRSWPTQRKAELVILEYIDGFYNPRRRHSAPARAGKAPWPSTLRPRE